MLWKGRDTMKLFAHEDAVIAGLAAASRLFITDRGVEALIF
jgi:hypothetical protein